MTVFNDVRESFANRFNDAADQIGHFGLSTREPFDYAHGVDLGGIDDSTPLNLSPIGAIVMTYHLDVFGLGWGVPDDWDRGDYWIRYSALAVFAQFLASGADDEYAGADNPADVINAWTRHRARTEKQVIAALRDAAHAVRDVDRGSELLAVL